MDNTLEQAFINAKIDPKYIPIAYAVFGLGLLVIMRKPSNIIPVISAVLLYHNVIQKTKDKFQEKGIILPTLY